VIRLRDGRPEFDFRKGGGERIFSIRRRVQTGPVTRLAFCPVDTGGKVAGTWSWPRTSI